MTQQIADDIQYKIENLKSELEKLNKRFELNTASVFSISVFQQKIIYAGALREFEAILKSWSEEKEISAEEIAKHFTERYFKQMSINSDRCLNKASTEFENSSRLYEYKELYKFFFHYLPEDYKKAIKLLKMRLVK